MIRVVVALATLTVVGCVKNPPEVKVESPKPVTVAPGGSGVDSNVRTLGEVKKN